MAVFLKLMLNLPGLIWQHMSNRPFALDQSGSAASVGPITTQENSVDTQLKWTPEISDRSISLLYKFAS